MKGILMKMSKEDLASLLIASIDYDTDEIKKILSYSLDNGIITKNELNLIVDYYNNGGF